MYIIQKYKDCLHIFRMILIKKKREKTQLLNVGNLKVTKTKQQNKKKMAEIYYLK